MNKIELLDSIRREHDALEALVASVDDQQLTAGRLDGGWSVKDVLAHISAWERLCASWLADVARGETPERPEVSDGDATNARFYDAAKGRPLADVIAESRQSHGALLQALEALSEADLADETRFGWPTWQMASSNSDEHYREHAGAIRAWLDGLSSR